jgi:hypothetical protein
MEDYMGRAFVMYGVEEKYIQGFGWLGCGGCNMKQEDCLKTEVYVEGGY